MPQKTKRYKSKKYVEAVSNLRCCISEYAESGDCRGPIQAHHLLKPYDGVRGMGMRSSDNNVIPLCYGHHAMLHDRLGSERALFERYGLDPDFGKAYAKALFEKYRSK